jgi:hypothetical protein
MIAAEVPPVDRLQQAKPGCDVPGPDRPLPRRHPSSSGNLLVSVVISNEPEHL